MGLYHCKMALLYSAIVVAVFVQVVAATQCYPENFDYSWNYVESDAGGVWYTHLDVAGDFNQQLENCENIGTGVTLASALNAQENDALYRSMPGPCMLGGFSVVPGSNEWFWVEGQKGDGMVSVKTTFWRPSEPSGGSENCIMIDTDVNGWNDVICGLKLYAVCQ